MSPARDDHRTAHRQAARRGISHLQHHRVRPPGQRLPQVKQAHGHLGVRHLHRGKPRAPPPLQGRPTHRRPVRVVVNLERPRVRVGAQLALGERPEAHPHLLGRQQVLRYPVGDHPQRVLRAHGPPRGPVPAHRHLELAATVPPHVHVEVRGQLLPISQPVAVHQLRLRAEDQAVRVEPALVPGQGPTVIARAGVDRRAEHVLVTGHLLPLTQLQVPDPPVQRLHPRHLDVVEGHGAVAVPLAEAQPRHLVRHLVGRRED